LVVILPDTGERYLSTTLFEESTTQGTAGAEKNTFFPHI